MKSFGRAVSNNSLIKKEKSSSQEHLPTVVENSPPVGICVASSSLGHDVTRYIKEVDTVALLNPGTPDAAGADKGAVGSVDPSLRAYIQNLDNPDPVKPISTNVIIHLQRLRDGTRRLMNITEVVGMEGDVVMTQDLVTYEITGEDRNGFITGHFKSSGLRPAFYEKARHFNLEKDLLKIMAAGIGK